jgi:hypothetical protein
MVKFYLLRRGILAQPSIGRFRAFIDTSPKHPFAGTPEVAIGHFLEFLLNPLNQRVGGSCAYCDKFFVKESERKKSV